MGHVIVTIDDTYAGQRLRGVGYARSKGITLGLAAIPGSVQGNSVNSSQFMSWQQLRECVEVFGHEVYTHAHTLPEHDNATLFDSANGFQTGEISIVKAKRLLVAQGLGANADVFVSPPSAPAFGDTNIGQAYHTILAKHFIGSRTFLSGYPSNTTNGTESVPPQNVFHIRTCGWSVSNTIAQVRDAITRARINPYAVVVLVFHDIKASGAAGIEINASDFQLVMDEIAFQRDSNYQSDLSSGTAGGKLVVSTLSQLMRGQLAPTS